jgi:F-type H+-transporting ATPase subunit epsilon
MAGKVYIEIITPDRTFFSGAVDMLIYPTTDGERGVMHNHAPMVTPVVPGEIRMKDGEKWIRAAVSEGFLEVTEDMTVMIVDTAEWPEEIDIARAQQAAARAGERLAAEISLTEHTRAKAALARAYARLKATKKIN